MNESGIEIIDWGIKRIHLCTQDRGSAGDTFYYLKIKAGEEPVVEQEIDYNDGYKTPQVTSVSKDQWKTLKVNGKTLSEYIAEKMPSE